MKPIAQVSLTFMLLIILASCGPDEASADAERPQKKIPAINELVFVAANRTNSTITEVGLEYNGRRYSFGAIEKGATQSLKGPLKNPYS